MESLDNSECTYQKLKSFREINQQFDIAFKLTEKKVGLSREEKDGLHLYYIARNILPVSQYFVETASHFANLLPKLLSIALTFDTKRNPFCMDKHLMNCILLGKLIQLRPDLEWYASKYFEKNPAPFSGGDDIIDGKRCKMRDNLNITDLEIVESVYGILKSNSKFYIKKWPWSKFAENYLNHTDSKVVWIACHCISIVSELSEQQLKLLINSKMTSEISEQYLCTYNSFKTLNKSEKSINQLDENPCFTITWPINHEVEEVAGIYIPKLKKPLHSPNSLIMVSSTYNNLRKIALGLTSNKAICLQGPVGSGKTSLIEHLAAKTGRTLGENLIKVQLGDQTDSKMLLGTYRCTDIPGEFVWQPGVVTQAIIEGDWLLLEDIDLANMDIASVLSSLLENGSLAVPGYKDSLSITPGFQLFFTQRLVSTVTGFHKNHSNAATLLEKHLLQINIDPLSSEELKTILITLHPEFTTISDRMLSVFHLFTKTNSNEISVPKTSRLISTRDFFKWCSRAALDFDVSSQASALKVLQDAIDVFCCSYQKSEDALNLAKEISTHLGIINQKAEYFFKNYKPNMALTSDKLNVGRASIARNNDSSCIQQHFYFTRPSAVLLERIICCVKLQEPVLLVGETGTGKTSSVQYLANVIGQKLIVINMNQQSDSADLLGGYKPVDLKFVIAPIRREFEDVFCTFFQVEPNKKFLGHIAYCFNEQRWIDLVKLMQKSYEVAVHRLNNSEKSDKNTSFIKQWQEVGQKLEKLSLQLKQKSSLAFAFIEGSLVKAVEEGHWVLLDEINLANAETLECLSGLLEGSRGSLCLLERGDKEPVKRHPNFTLFACMNPSTDVGKKDLPAGLRNRFTEFFVDELIEKSDLLLLVSNYLNALSLKDSDLEKIVDFYLKVRKATETSLTDGLGHKPHFSLRSLCRALMITARNPCGMFKRSLYEAFSLSFLTQLDEESYKLMENMISKYLIGDPSTMKSVLKQPIPEPRITDDSFVQFEGYWVRKGNLECTVPEDYILTSSVRKNLKDLVRIVSIGGLPVLLQGNTSVGKTSLIIYLAKSSGNKCVRINNHEHTDLQEYIGSYVADSTGKLVFKEGVLVEAMRKGYWIILDELNLAPTDVLEALNRVLDDNRELFIPETQQTVKADPNFMLFATQNPPGSYGGRKMLSRAFRNRFVELHFNEIPPAELEFILHKRCQMAPSYAKKMIAVMTELQARRRGSATFDGKHGFITLRDLFRWGERYRLAQNTQKLYDWDQHLADEGYLVLAGRVRKTEEKHEIIQVLQKYLKRQVNPHTLFTLSDETSVVTREILKKLDENRHRCENIVWTYNMRQLAVLVAKAFQFKEPVLLVGETGGGKTTVCKIIAEQNGQELKSINCHMHTESSDFIGGLRPVRDHKDDDVNRLFEWVDGPLIQAMLNGDVFLADEISLADDSVLERLNSLLEPERSLLLAEKGGDINNSNNSELIIAHSNFYFIGTMNPGGDFGKKELSPALRNRFTEIWCESCSDKGDLIRIIERNIKTGISFGNQEDGSSGIGAAIMDFIEWYKNTEIGKRLIVSIRDILTWVNFINKCADKIDVAEVYFHGACLTFLDGLGSGITGTESLKTLSRFKSDCENFLLHQIKILAHSTPDISLGKLLIEIDSNSFGIKPFYIDIGSSVNRSTSFSFNAPTTIYNTLRLLRGLQLNKAILLEGSPGVGKTSLVSSLAKATGHKLFRVNLSDQTDISDLFGADLPVEGGTGGQFSWRDGPLLQALKQGHWILLDELNLASQSVLEGLNACLDHRGEIYIPELAKSFKVKPGTRFFACQNPLKQGGCRRGLPKSFLNRFIQVFVDSLSEQDLGYILRKEFPNLPQEVLERMLLFNSSILKELDDHNFGNKGAPWEFNLRDLTRWCEATVYHYDTDPTYNSDKKFAPENLVQLIYADRMRSLSDKIKISEIFERVFNRKISGDAPAFFANTNQIFFGDVSLSRNTARVDADAITQEKSCLVLRTQLSTLRSLALCVNLNWMSLLVGSAAAGKSSVVRVLANLAGKTLRTLPVTSAMDTTDILGGFEQTDYRRHLEEIVKETERLLFETVRSQLINGRSCLTPLRLWETYTNINGNSQTRTMAEETEHFLEKLDALETIWRNLSSSNDFKSTEALNRLRIKAETLRKGVKTEGSLNAGGKFEWVDSVLIKCLEDGSWLLVDNVNLCSAAVLDRLNALLEPHGVLTIGERGVDAAGRMVEIKPHPDFRLFLTMDPKNGEISRAMRNRGVEIYVLSEKEAESKNDFDLKSMINQVGLTNVKHIDALLNLHYFVSDLILSEKPNVNELLRAGALISQEIHVGASVSDAFIRAIEEVYYKSRVHAEFNCNDFHAVICTEIKKALEESENVQDDLYCQEVTLRTDNLQICASFEQIKQQSVHLRQILKHTQSDEVFNDDLKYALVNFYSIGSLDDLNLRHQYLSSLLKKSQENLKVVAQSLFTCLQEMNVHNKEFPLDRNYWFPQINFVSKYFHMSQRVILGLHFKANLQKELLEVCVQKKKIHELSLIHYMTQREDKKIDDLFDDVLIDNFLTLVYAYDDYITVALDRSWNLTHEGVVKILELLFWRSIFFRVTLINIKKSSEPQRYILKTNLKVHYRWFLKYSLNSVRKILTGPLPEKLEDAVTTIDKSLEKQFSSLHQFSKYHKFNKKPPPKISNEQIEFETLFHEVTKNINICDKNNDVMVILNLFNQNPQLRKSLINLKLEDFDYQSKYKLLKTLQEQITSDAKFNRYKSEVLPFEDCFIHLKVKRAVQLADTCPEFETSSIIPIELATCILLYFKTRDTRLTHEITKSYYNYLMNSACVRSEAYFESKETQILSNFAPNLIYHTTNLLIGADGRSVATFGNFRDLQKQHRCLSWTLWRNLIQIQNEDYDYLMQDMYCVRESFKNFIEELALSLKISDCDLCKKIKECLDKVAPLKNCGGFSKSFVEHLQNCVRHYNDLTKSIDVDNGIFLISFLRLELSYVKAILNSRLPLIDPSAKKALKKKYCLEQINSFEDLKQSFVIMNRVYTGNDKSLHCLHDPIAKTIDALKSKNEKLGSYVAVRPINLLYEDIVKAVNHGFSTILWHENVKRILEGLAKSIKDTFRNDSVNFKQYDSAISSLENLISEWMRYQSSYCDIIEPLLANISEFLYGLKCSLALLKKVIECNKTKDLQEELVKLVQLPSLDCVDSEYVRLIDSYVDNKFQSFVIPSHNESLNLKKRETLRLFKCGIQESFNNCVVEAKPSGNLNGDVFKHFEDLIRGFVEAFNRQEKEREMRQNEADSLYKTKTKCDDKTEAEQIEDELQELFPNYHDKDFADMRRSDLCGAGDVEKVDKDFSGLISDEDIKFVADLHMALLQNFTKTEWMDPEKNKNITPDFINPLVEKYKVLKIISERFINSLDYRLDRKLAESVAVLMSFVQNYGDTKNLVPQSSPTRLLHDKRYDFYQNPNVNEVKSSFHILEELKVRVLELLDEWPEQSTLKTILTVIDRIYSFDLLSPLSRFLTGFEILLSKCNEWEEVAHSGVTLSQHSQNITHQIIAWRKIELNVWKDLLNSTFHRLNAPIYKWWLYLYNIMEQFTTQEKFTELELIETLQDYVTRSNLAEYENRLNLLHAFHCHAVHLKSGGRAKAFVSILWNLHCYFQQFNLIVTNKIKDLRAPIEKKLRDYVKIVRWKDINYWAIKETVDKSHKTLHKYVREFQDAMRQPVSPCLVNTSTPNNQENIGIWDRPQRNIVKTYHYTLDSTKYIAPKKPNCDTLNGHEDVFTKLDSCFAESRKVCKDSIDCMKYPKLIQSLDNFVTQIIENSSHLQGLEVDTTLAKDKQKSLAKSILQQKRRALADLFQTLSKIGLSFKTGIVEAKLKMAAEEFLMRPLDISANFNHIHYNRKDEKILIIWDKCETYYLKALMRADVLDSALKNPAQDLGLQNIARCRGYSANLLTLAQKQKAQLTESSTCFYYLRHYTNQMAKVCEAEYYLSMDIIERLQTIMKNVVINITQIQIFLNCCPAEEFSDSETPAIVILKPEPMNFVQYKNDQVWSKAYSLTTEILNISNKLSTDLAKQKGDIPATECVIVRLKFVPVIDLNDIETKLNTLSQNLDSLVGTLGPLNMCKSLKWLQFEIVDLQKQLKTSKDDCQYDKELSQELLKKVDEITDSCSSMLKTISKKYCNEATEPITEDVDEINIEDDHLRSQILNNISNDLQILKMEEILKLCTETAQIFFEVHPNNLKEPKSVIRNLLPLLEQEILFYQYFLTQQVSAYRITCKMSSVLLNIFIDLASKGFCVPPELTDDGEEGVGKPSDGLGLGEGQGERDVSDRIESEDQLDDAQPAGEEKRNQDEDCKEEDKGIEMSEDFDSKLQDVEEKDDDDNESADSDADEQMGDTEENAKNQNKEAFGSDDEEGEAENNEEKEDNRDGGEQEGEAELGAKEKDESKNTNEKDKDSSKEKEEQQKEINELEEKEFDDNQVDPYHGNQPELPEPEPMDLPDDLQLDDGVDNDNEGQDEENPFDIDAMKEDNPFEKEDKSKDEEPNEKERDDINDLSSDDEEITHKSDEEEGDNVEEQENRKSENNETAQESEKEGDEESAENIEESALDQTQTNENNVEAMDVDKTDASDKTQANEAQNQKSKQPIEELCQEDKPDQEGVGQSQMEESSTGHRAQTTAPQEMKSSKREREEEKNKPEKPGISDSQRSLGDINEPVKKKLKTIDDKNTDENEENPDIGEDENEKEASEMYKHIKDAKEKSTQVLDAATKEQAESQKNNVEDLENQEEEDVESSANLPDEDDDKVEPDSSERIQKSEKTEGKKDKKNKVEQHPEGEALDEVQNVEIEGDIVETMDVSRGFDTTYNTLFDNLRDLQANRLSLEEVNTIRSDVEKQLSAWNEVASDSEAEKTWQKITSITSSLAQDLSEQLRLVLEPTQASRLKGDFRTGRRINMRKVIPYIASQFRKDKIWLRRTKPSKREYQIVLAIDDSASMSDNHSKELAFESVALISKALTLLESGQLSVVSFGEEVEVLHRLTDQFTERSGVKMLKKFQFGQNKTCVGKLVNFVAEMFAQSPMQSSALNAKLLVIVSDGRGIFSEGESFVRQAVRRAKLSNIFMVFVIVDNPVNKHSILDIRMPVFVDGKLNGIQNYMDVFPFSFYIILRDINSLPNVLGDALRQWFELVSNYD